MNKKITFPELIESVATTTEASKRTSEMFLKELFAVIADSLVKGENVKIKNFGQFKLTEVGERKSVNVNTGEEMKIPSHTKVSFVPDKVLADAINMPFANFEAIELSDNISESELKIMASTEDGQVAKADAEGRKKQFDGETVDSGNGMKENETTEDLHENHEQDNAVATEPEIEGADIDDSKEEGSISPDAEEECAGKVVEADVFRDDSEICENSSKNKETTSTSNFGSNGKSLGELQQQLENKYTPTYKKSMFFKGYFWGAVTMLLISAVAFYSYYLYVRENRSSEEAVAFATSSMAENNENDSVISKSKIDNLEKNIDIKIAEDKNNVFQAAEVRYDTVSRIRYLTTMSREYYGDFRFWVYIYEENKANIDNPNAIAPGTVVVIPAASKYGIDKDNPASVEKAKAKAVEILATSR